jgi:hypothetical protein
MAPSGSNVNSNAAENAERIHGEIEALHARVREKSANFRDFWGRVKEINGLFQTLRPLVPDDRRRLWARLDAACAEAKERQAENKKNWESRKAVSANKRSLVESKIREAYFQAKGGSDTAELAKADELLNTARGWMKAGWSAFTHTTELFAFDDGKMTKDDHDACWERWNEAKEMLQSRRQQLGEYHYSRYRGEAEDAIGIAEYDPRAAKEKVQAIQKSINGIIMNGDQFSEVRRLLDKAWKHASGKQTERHDDWVKRQAEWKERQTAHIHRKRELMRQAEEFIDRLEGQIDHCRDLEANARSDDYASTVRGWIEEKYDLIREKRRFISELREQICDIESKLQG